MITHGRNNRIRWVSPFGNRRINACSRLPDAYRSVPRPSSPVHAKASTNCPYLTLESPHHQRQHWMDLAAHTKLGRAVMRGFTRRNRERSRPLDADDLNLSCIRAHDRSGQTRSRHPCSGFRPRRCRRKPKPSRHRFEKPIHNVKKQALASRKYRCSRNGSRCFIIWISWLVGCARCAVSRSKAAPCGALCSAGRPCRGAI